MKKQFFRKVTALALAACLLTGSVPTVALAEAVEPTIIATDSDLTLTEATAEPTEVPTAEPTSVLDLPEEADPTAEPVENPTEEPTAEPTEAPTAEPTAEPTAAPTLPEQVLTVQALVDALPDVDALTAENMDAAYAQTQTAYDAYEALTAEEQAAIDGAEKFAALFAVFNSQTNEQAEITFYVATKDMRDVTDDTAYTTYTVHNGTTFQSWLDANLPEMNNTEDWQYYPANFPNDPFGFGKDHVIEQSGRYFYIGTANTVSFTFNVEETATRGTKFFDFLKNQGMEEDDITARLYQVKRANEDTYSNVDETTVIEEGDTYRLFYFLGSDTLVIYVSCNASELPTTGYTSYTIAPNVTVTVTHNVNGTSTDCTLTSDSSTLQQVIIPQLPEAQKGYLWYYRQSDTDAWKTIRSTNRLPLTTATFIQPQIMNNYHSVNINSTDHCSAKISPDSEITYWQEGEKVTLAVTVDNDYQLDALTITAIYYDAEAAQITTVATITATENGDGTYSFTMPSGVTYSYVQVQFFATPKSGTHDFNISCGTDGYNWIGGTVTLTDDSCSSPAEEGAEIKLIVTPDNGYELTSLTATYGVNSSTRPSQNTDGTYTINMPNRTLHVVAVFTQTAYSVIIDSEIVNGTVTAIPSLAKKGETITLTLTPDNDYALSTLTVEDNLFQPIPTTQDANDSTKYTFTMPEGDVRVSATFMQSSSASTVSFTYDGTPCTANSDTKFLAFLAESNLSEDDMVFRFSRDNGTTWSIVDADTVIQNGDVYQRFYQIHLVEDEMNILSIYASCAASDLPTTGYDMCTLIGDATVTVTHNVNGKDQTFNMTSETGTAFSSVIAGGYENTGSIWYRKTDSGEWESFDLANDLPFTKTTYVAPMLVSTFHWVSLNGDFLDDEGNSDEDRSCDLALVPASDRTYWEEGDKITFSITPKGGTDYILNELSISLTSDETGVVGTITATKNASGYYTFTMPTSSEDLKYDSVSVYAFAANPSEPHEVFCYYGTDGDNYDGGIAYVDSEDGEFASETSIPLVVKIYDGYELASLTVRDGLGNAIDDLTQSSTSADEDGNTVYNYTFTMPSRDVTVTVKFKAKDTSTYTITVADGIEHGTVTPDKTTASESDSVTLTVTPDSGYVLSSLTVTDDNGTTITTTDNGDGTHTFTMPESNVKATATFVQAPYYAIYDGTNSAVSTLTFDTTTARAGETVTFTLKVNEGYTLAPQALPEFDGSFTYYNNTTGNHALTITQNDYDEATNTYTVSFTMPNEMVSLRYRLLCPVTFYLGDELVTFKLGDKSFSEQMVDSSGVYSNDVMDYVSDAFRAKTGISTDYDGICYFRLKHRNDSTYSDIIPFFTPQPGDEVHVAFARLYKYNIFHVYIFSDVSASKIMTSEPTDVWDNPETTYMVCSGSLKMTHKVNGVDTVFTLTPGKDTLLYALDSDGNCDLVWCKVSEDNSETIQLDNGYDHQPPLVSTKYTCYSWIEISENSDNVTISGTTQKDDGIFFYVDTYYRVGTTVTLTLDRTKSLESIQGVHTPPEGDITSYNLPFTRTSGEDDTVIYTFTMPADVVVITLGNTEVYSISVDDPGLSVDKQSAADGEKVTITIKNGYADVIKKLYLNGTDVRDQFTEGADGEYTYTFKPETFTTESDVTITTEKQTHSITFETDDAVKKSARYNQETDEERFTVTYCDDKGTRSYAYKASTITVKGNLTAASLGDTITLNITPFCYYKNDEYFGCYLVKLEMIVDGESTDVTPDVTFENTRAYTPATYTFTMPNADVHFKATFEKWGADGNLQHGGYEGLLGCDSHLDVFPGDVVTYTAVETVGQKFVFKIDHLEMTGGGDLSPSFKGTYDESEETYTFTVPPMVDPLEKQTIKVCDANGTSPNQSPNNGFETIIPEISITAANGTVRATATVTNTATTIISKNTDPVKVSANAYSVVTLDLVPDANESLESLTVDGVDVTESVVNDQYLLNVTANEMEVVATFTTTAPTTYSITIDPTNNGAVTAKETSAESGKKVTLTVTPNSGYVLDTLTVDGETVEKDEDGEYTFTMPEYSVTVSATFKAIGPLVTLDGASCTLKFEPDGSDNENHAEMHFAEGTTVTFSINPANGYVLSGMTIKVMYEYLPVATLTATQNTDGTYSFTMPTSSETLTYDQVSVDVSCANPNEGHLIFLDAGSDTGWVICTVENTEIWSARSGDDVTLTVKPEEGYELDTLTVKDCFGNAVTLTPAGKVNGYDTYTFTMLNRAVYITATFKEKAATTTYSITVVSKYCTIDVPTTAAANVTVELIVSSIQGNRDPSALILTVTDKGGNTVETTFDSSKAVYTFTMPESDVTVNAGFPETTYTVTLDNSITAYTTITGYTSQNLIATNVYTVTEGTAITLTVDQDKLPEGAALLALNVTDTGTGNIGSTGTSSQSVPLDANSQYTFTPDNNVTITPDIYGYTVTLTTANAVDGCTATLSCAEGDSKVIDGVTYYKARAEVTVNVTPAEGYAFIAKVISNDASFLYDGERTISPIRFKVPDGAVNVGVTFKPAYTLIFSVANVSEGVFTLDGYAMAIPGGSRYTVAEGETVTLAVDLKKLKNENHAVVLSVTTTTSSDAGTVTTTLSPTGQNGKAVCTFTMPAANTFLNVTLGHQLTIETEGGGTVTPTYESERGTFDGDNLYIAARSTVTLTPSSGYVVESVKLVNHWRTNEETGEHLDVTSGAKVQIAADGSCTFEMTDAYATATVTLAEKPKYDITYNVTPERYKALAFSKEPTSATVGETVTVKVNSSILSLYNLKDFLTVTAADNTPVTVVTQEDHTFTFTMPNSPVTVNLVLKTPHTVTMSKSSNGTVTAPASACESETVTLTVKPSSGYFLKQLTVTKTGDSNTTVPVTMVEGTTNQYTFTMPDYNVTVTPTFQREGNLWSITCEEGFKDWYTFSLEYTFSNPGMATTDTIVTITDKTGGNLEFSITYRKGIKNQTDKVENLTFRMPSANVTITATRKADPTFTITIPATVNLSDPDSKMTVSARDVANLMPNESITVSATSANGGKLKSESGSDEIPYTFTESLSFTENGDQSLGLSVNEADTTGKPAGTYTDTLTFTVTVSDGATGATGTTGAADATGAANEVAEAS